MPVLGGCDEVDHSLLAPELSNPAMHLYGKCWGGHSWQCMLLQSLPHLRTFSWPDTVPGIGATLSSGFHRAYVLE